MPNPPEGLPIYGFETLLRKLGLATAGMLKQHRRRQAESQRPVACYWTGHAYANLYNEAEAVDLPPLPPGRQRRYDEARTCAECGKRALDPFGKGRDDRRYCSPCQGPVHERLWREERAADRPVIAAWAREVLADPRTVLAGVRSDTYWREVFVIDVAGREVLDARVRHHDAAPDPAHPRAAELSLMPSPSEMLAALDEGRVISWWWTTSPPSADGRSVVAEGDLFGRWWARWVGELAPGATYRFHPRVADQSPPVDSAEQAGRMLELLHEMSAWQSAAVA